MSHGTENRQGAIQIANLTQTVVSRPGAVLRVVQVVIPKEIKAAISKSLQIGKAVGKREIEAHK